MNLLIFILLQLVNNFILHAQDFQGASMEIFLLGEGKLA